MWFVLIASVFVASFTLSRFKVPKFRLEQVSAIFVVVQINKSIKTKSQFEFHLANQSIESENRWVHKLSWLKASGIRFYTISSSSSSFCSVQLVSSTALNHAEITIVVRDIKLWLSLPHGQSYVCVTRRHSLVDHLFTQYQLNRIVGCGPKNAYSQRTIRQDVKNRKCVCRHISTNKE